MSTVESRLRELISRHITPTGVYKVHPNELLNVLEPGSAPMYPRDTGHSATCGVCAPDGDGRSKRGPQ